MLFQSCFYDSEKRRTVNSLFFESARISTWFRKTERWFFFQEYGVHFSNSHDMTTKIFFSGAGTTRRFGKQKFCYFNHFSLKYRSCKIKNLASERFYGKMGFFMVFWKKVKKSSKIENLILSKLSNLDVVRCITWPFWIFWKVLSHFWHFEVIPT